MVFTDVIQVPQVGTGITARLRGSNSVEARVTAELGQAGTTVTRPGALDRRA